MHARVVIINYYYLITLYILYSYVYNRPDSLYSNKYKLNECILQREKERGGDKQVHFRWCILCWHCWGALNFIWYIKEITRWYLTNHIQFVVSQRIYLSRNYRMTALQLTVSECAPAGYNKNNTSQKGLSELKFLQCVLIVMCKIK